MLWRSPGSTLALAGLLALGLGASTVIFSVFDAVLLSDADGAIADRLGRFEVSVTAVMTGPLVFEAAAQIVQAASNLPVGRHSELVVSAWPLADGGALVRMCGLSVERVTAALHERLAFLRRLLGDDPWSRKW